jgi:hypothetical protein
MVTIEIVRDLNATSLTVGVLDKLVRNIIDEVDSFTQNEPRTFNIKVSLINVSGYKNYYLKDIKAHYKEERT